MTGCDSGLSILESAAPGTSTSRTFDAETYATNRVVLDWGGGANRIYPGREFAGVDFSRFPVWEGGTLADDSGEFQEAVRLQVAEILSGLPGLRVTVENGEFATAPGATVVLLTQGVSPRGGDEVGEGEFDPCDHESDSRALVFGEGLRRLLGSASWDEWVLAFANVAAHEVGHTLGFDHTPRDDSEFHTESFEIQLMLDGHTADELRRPQSFLETHMVCDASRGL